MDNTSRDAVVIMLGSQRDQVELSYSYDLTVSELGSSSDGAHELAV